MKPVHLMAAACVMLGIIIGLMLRDGSIQAAETKSNDARPVRRFEISSWMHVGHGCYIVDTATGELWHVEASNVHKIGQPLLKD